MQRTTRALGAFTIDVWNDPASPTTPTQDASVAMAAGDTVWIAAIDGCSLSRPGPRTAGMEGGAWAAAVVRATLSGGSDVDDAIRCANAALHDPSAGSARDLPQACVVVGVIEARSARLVRAGDCEAWSYCHGGWERLFAAEIRTPDARARFRAWEDAHPDASPDERYDAEIRLWAAPAAWHTAALGRFADTRLERRHISDFDALVVATDGARLTADRLRGLEDWLVGLRAWERAHASARAGGKIHDDVAVVRVTRQ